MNTIRREDGKRAMKVIRFKISTTIPMNDRTKEEIEKELMDALDSIKAEFATWTSEITDEEDN